MLYSNLPISKYVLFTGAGFTHNYGGYLSSEMWEMIFNSLNRSESNKSLVQSLRDEFNYEEFYQKVVHEKEGYTYDQQKNCKKIVLKAYEFLDREICQHNRNEKRNVSFYFNGLEEFISLFAGNKNDYGFFFTINQDLFIERYINPKNKKPISPCIFVDNTRFNINNEKPLSKDDLPKVPILEEEINKSPDSLSKLNYIKLHGSYDWRNENDNEIMIIGTNKLDIIKRYAILLWYFELFNYILSLSGIHLLIIGYGFRDPHINKVIADSVKKNDLKIFIISHNSQKEFNKLILKDSEKNGKSDCNTIWNAISHFCSFKGTLNQLFYSQRIKYNQILSNFFN